MKKNRVVATCMLFSICLYEKKNSVNGGKLHRVCWTWAIFKTPDISLYFMANPFYIVTLCLPQKGWWKKKAYHTHPNQLHPDVNLFFTKSNIWASYLKILWTHEYQIYWFWWWGKKYLQDNSMFWQVYHLHLHPSLFPWWKTKLNIFSLRMGMNRTNPLVNQLVHIGFWVI